MFEFLFGLLSSIFGSIFYDQGLNTKRVDRHIEKLGQYPWFKKIYENKRYHRLFFVNYRIREYLQSSFRVKQLIKSQKRQKKFKQLLEVQLTKSK
ncbi:hypothetical protein FHY65_27460 [Bacillus cereus]|uniref:hypothetical protein n=1 Tax=Bacillus TaxID=1386 RepID=UPI000279E156|nr:MULTISPECIES: hypothetical protein [Bacillus]EJR55373.1 hypothetical protein IK3_05681 [Bacillus toyonensis]MBY7137090.1 hypothetical protein [Bacillus sp. 12RED03]MCU4830758.1 hypothetical protein [Bacillus toyonensis]PEO28901.1 hypothetical protein CN569_23650 [Bacillus toyonensis]PHF42611.1 hypothetical protein COF85_00060 [Bacillus toyonensis]